MTSRPATADDMVRCAPIPIVAIDRAGNMAWWNPAAERVFGWRRDEVIGREPPHVPDDQLDRLHQRLDRLFREETIAPFEARRQRKDGSSLLVRIAVAPLRREDGEIVASVAVMTDITDLREREQQARHEAEHDPLTGLANRRRFNREIAALAEAPTAAALLIADLDGFKQVNTDHGLLGGDACLREAADRLRQAIRDRDLPARFGGDEFAVLLPETGLAAAAQVAERIRAAFADEPVRIEGTEARITMSIGLALIDPGADPEEAISRADDALQRAKRKGRNRVEASGAD